MWKRLNRWLDGVPLSRFFSGGSGSAYRSCGTAGFYVALITTWGAALLTGRPLAIAAVLACVCAASFFAYAFLRRLVAGRECLVLLEHVWAALGCCAGVLWLLDEPVAVWLDVITPGLCFFLAAGRLGCLLVGCCHGRPSAIGIVYPAAHVERGLRSELAGVRLFPVQLLEMIGLVFIGCSGLAWLPAARPGGVLAWYLLAYSTLRFGTEAARGDRRPHWLGLSQPRWMALAELAFALAVLPERRFPGVVWLAAGAALLTALGLRRRFDWRRRMLRPGHVREIRELVGRCVPDGTRDTLHHPVAAVTSERLAVAVSEIPDCAAPCRYVSLSLPESRDDLGVLCRLAALAFPGVCETEAQCTKTGVLHLLLPLPLPAAAKERKSGEQDGLALYYSLVRRSQREDERASAGNAAPPRTPGTASAQRAPFAPAAPQGPQDWVFLRSPNGRRGEP